MASLKMCLTCGVVSTSSRCDKHSKTTARGYGWSHQQARASSLKLKPVCVSCGHMVRMTGRCGVIGCKRCPLEWHHVVGMKGGRTADTDDRRQLLCRLCHLAVKED